MDNKIPSTTKITTIKLSEATKARLEYMKLHKRETYEELLQRILTLLNTTRSNPEKAQSSLINLERQKRRMK